MKKTRPIPRGLLLALVGLVGLLLVGWYLHSPTTPSASVNTSGTTSSELIYVNNDRCAMSGSALAPDVLGKFESHVVYDGPIEKYRGKTLVFNQCCNGCIENFPKKWANQRDEIMREFGLDESESEDR